MAPGAFGLSLAGGDVAPIKLATLATEAVGAVVCAGTGVLGVGVDGLTGALNAVCAKLHAVQPVTPLANVPFVIAETVTFIVPVSLSASTIVIVVAPPASATT